MHKNLIYKYLQGNASELEIESIYNWIEASNKNKEEFIALKKAWVINNPIFYDNSDWIQVKNNLNFKPKQSIKLYKYAAAIVILLSIGGIWYAQNKETAVYADTANIVLEIENGNTYQMLDNESSVVKNISGAAVAMQSKNELIYNQSHSSQASVLHTIKVPFGKTFKLLLSDGTTVHLNSGSALTYPQTFTEGLNRLVKLTGEAYFEVVKNEESPFIVETTDLKIEVLGTKFNVSSYETDSVVETALIEGSVKVTNKSQLDGQVILIPDYMSSWNKRTKKLSVSEINTSQSIAWVYGELHFSSMQFEDIAIKLERAYNVNLQIDYTVLKTEKFTGTFKIESVNITDVLDLIKIDTDFNYITKEKTIIINPPTNL